MADIDTPRLILRPWRESDLAPLAALNADPDVMRYFPAGLSNLESEAMAKRCRDFILERGWGPWVAEERATGQFIGVIGLYIPTVPLPFSPCVEILWRIAKTHWGKGFATEGAAASLKHAFEVLKLREVVSFTSIHNLKSAAVMERLGMHRDAETFRHPSLPPDHWLSEHCLYRKAAVQ